MYNLHLRKLDLLMLMTQSNATLSKRQCVKPTLNTAPVDYSSGISVSAAINIVRLDVCMSSLVNRRMLLTIWTGENIYRNKVNFRVTLIISCFAFSSLEPILIGDCTHKTFYLL